MRQSRIHTQVGVMFVLAGETKIPVPFRVHFLSHRRDGRDELPYCTVRVFDCPVTTLTPPHSRVIVFIITATYGTHPLLILLTSVEDRYRPSPAPRFTLAVSTGLVLPPKNDTSETLTNI